MNRLLLLILAALTTATLLSASALADERTPLDAGAIAKAAAAIDDARLAGRDGDRGNWLTYNGQWTEQRFSPLDQVNADNVSELGSPGASIDRVDRGLEATPLVVDGVMYTTGTVERRVRGRRQDRQGDLALRPQGRRSSRAAEGLLRRRKPRRRRLQGQGLRRHARRRG